LSVAAEHTTRDPFLVSAATVELGGDPVLADVELRVPPGQCLALLGANGSGKSTLLRVMLGLQPVTTGSVSIFGTAAAKYRDWQRISYVPQHLLASSAVPVSVTEVVSVGLAGQRLRLSRADRDAVASSLQEVGLSDRRKDSFHDLSGGQQRRAMIAAALVKDAEVLLLDEPTAGLDKENISRLAAILAEYKKRDRTIVVVAHELGALESLVDRCIVLKHGDGPSIRYDGPAPAPETFHDPHGHHDEPGPEQDRPWGLTR
jgi:zinc transport system ATP-binding protein